MDYRSGHVNSKRETNVEEEDSFRQLIRTCDNVDNAASALDSSNNVFKTLLRCAS